MLYYYISIYIIIMSCETYSRIETWVTAIIYEATQVSKSLDN